MGKFARLEEKNCEVNTTLFNQSTQSSSKKTLSTTYQIWKILKKYWLENELLKAIELLYEKKNGRYWAKCFMC